MKYISTKTIGLIIYLNIFAQTTQIIVLEPLGRYLYQSYNDRNAGIDHILNATGLSDGRIMVIGRLALTIMKVSDMSISGSNDFEIRTVKGGVANEKTTLF